MTVSGEFKYGGRELRPKGASAVESSAVRPAGKDRGVHLTGYGAVFTLEVNLVPTANGSPFRPAYTAQEIKNLNRQKREKLGLLKTEFPQLLMDQTAALGQVPASEKAPLS